MKTVHTVLLRKQYVVFMFSLLRMRLPDEVNTHSFTEFCGTIQIRQAYDPDQLLGKKQLLKRCVFLKMLIGCLLLLTSFPLHSLLCIIFFNVVVKLPMCLLVSSLLNLYVLLETESGRVPHHFPLALPFILYTRRI